MLEHGQHTHGEDPHHHEVGALGEAIDPVCGMRVPPTSPHRAVHQGREHVFCSARCREKFVLRGRRAAIATQ